MENLSLLEAIESCLEEKDYLVVAKQFQSTKYYRIKTNNAISALALLREHYGPEEAWLHFLPMLDGEGVTLLGEISNHPVYRKG